MITISLCMIVKNEEAVIGRCLDSVSALVEEIIIVDTGSTDRTKEICQQYTDHVIDFQWIDNFAAARNFSFQQATQDYVMWLDADDVLTADAQEKLRRLKQTLADTVDAVSMDYHLGFDEVGNVTSSLKRYRLVKKVKKFQWIGAVHEFLDVSGNLMDSDIAITHSPLSHDDERNIRIYRKLIESGAPLSPRDTFYFANELVDHRLFKEAIHYYETFLNSKLGWVEDNIRACLRIADCYHELDNQEKSQHATLQTLLYDAPRPETCCRLGYYFMEQGNNAAAIHWYEQALLDENQQRASFQNISFSTWLPHLQLCVLYDRLQNHTKAYEHNEAARAFRPTDTRILGNKKYLDTLLKK